MGQRTRHFCALMKKNWIVWKRTLAASLCELFCPVLLMAVIAIVRPLVDSNVIAPQSNMYRSTLLAPMVYPDATRYNLIVDGKRVGGLPLVNATYMAYQEQNFALANFSNTDPLTGNPLAKFLPAHCIKRRTDIVDYPYIGVSGPEKYISNLMKDINELISLQKEVSKLLNLMITPEQRKKIAAAGFSAGIDVNFVIKQFTNHQEMKDYVASPNYMQNKENPGLCFGFSIEEKSEDEIDIKMSFSGTFQDPQSQSIPNQLQAVWSEFDVNADFESYNFYTQRGYALIQNWVVNQILRVKSGIPTASIGATLVPFKTDQYVEDKFALIFSTMMPFFMLLIYILPMYRLLSNMVSEKESKARESMKMMGLVDFSYWLSWFVYYLIIVTIISALCILVLSFNVIKYSNRGLVFVFFELFGLSLFGLAIFLQSFFSKARIAAITGTLIYFGTSFLNVVVADPSVKSGPKSFASLLTTIAINRGCNNLGQFETSGIGLQAGNLRTQYENYTMGSCFAAMIISLILFFWVGVWLDNVLPSAYGLRKGWCFCCSPHYWCGRVKKERKGGRIDAESAENELYFEAKHMKKENFEPVDSRDLHKQEADKKILRIQDLKKTFENGFQAVKGVNLKMYNGQIFALLGHNGAGKTTTISMLTGLINSTGGSAEVFGIDLFEDMHEVRSFLGVCPQHDILFDLLTPEEHLQIFCEFKGVPRKEQDEEIRKMLIDVDVMHHKDTIAENLSGGSRRKLSVAIALIGGSKLVLLDEPTSGMDLSARRKLWNMLKNYKHNRIIILTTHYMDEADILGDRIGIMTGGQLICLGSSLFLKNRFGVGYNLTMVKKTKDSNKLIGNYLLAHLGSEVKLLSEVSSEITFQIPHALSAKFKDFFAKFDDEIDQLGIRSYGISVTTLEEVFLKVGHGELPDDKVKSSEVKSALEASQRVPLVSADDDFSIADPKYHQTESKTFFQHLAALFLKRFFIYRRNRKGLIIEVFIPVLLVIIGFSLSKVRYFVEQPNREFTPMVFPKQRILANQNLIVSAASAADNISPQSLISAFTDYSKQFSFTYQNNAQPKFTPTDTKELQMAAQKFDNDVFENRLAESYSPYRFGSYFVVEANNRTKQFKTAIFMNLTSQDVTPAIPHFMYEAILRQALGRPNFKLRLTTTPYPITEKLRQRSESAGGIFTSFVVSIGFALIPATVVSFIMNEREKNLKHQQVISGMSLTAYWISNLIFDLFKGMIPSAIVIGLIYAYNLEWDNTWLLFILYIIGVIPFTYVTSFFFNSENVAQTITIFMHFVFAGVGAIVVFVLRLIDSTYEAGDILQIVLKIIPSFCLTDTIMFDSSKARIQLMRPELKRDSDWDITILGGNVLALCLHFIVWLIVLLFIELGAFSWIGKIINVFGKNQIPPKTDQQLQLDEDVVEEEERVALMNPQNLKVRVHKFRKIYPGLIRDPVLAVERTSFGLDYGECFALLGINGAGKSTTFKALTCEIQQSGGEITIAGFNAQSEFNQARKLIGYCPQYDAIFELMTVEEHLEYYARIKGIPANLRERMIEKAIQDLNLDEHRKKPAGTLSGGNKRKLSVAMSILGNPPIILLDEPSAGMDPEARRFMWTVVARISQQRKKSAVILTTHSMEEAEALSTKMGIMVTGGVFKCFGSSQHIKNKFGTGYEIEIKIKKLSDPEIHQNAARFNLDNQLKSQQLIQINNLMKVMADFKCDPFLIDEIKLGGLGEDLVKEQQEIGGIDIQNFVLWEYIEQAGLNIVNILCDQFPSVEILEHYNDYYKLRIPKGDKTIGFVFGFIEAQKQELKISEYSVSQTTLEQIFQSFANLKIDSDVARKLTFKKQGSRAEIYTDRKTEHKRTYSKDPSKTNQP